MLRADSIPKFQSTLPRGERRCMLRCKISDIIISIHAPARGATVIPFLHLPSLGFQSTLPRGERLQEPNLRVYANKFQSTLPRGERLCLRFFTVSTINFNPRSREGSDYSESIRLQAINYFNPRSREGSDNYNPQALTSPKISIHAPARGATI